MFDIIKEIPFYVGPLFILLLVGGVKARKTGRVPLITLFLVPSIFLSWFSYSFFGLYGFNLLAMLLGCICLGVGGLVGFMHIQKLPLQFDRQIIKV